MTARQEAAGQGRAWIAARIPHAGAMCLLDEVVEASPEAIACLCRSHRDLANPLRRAGRLGAACGVEIASQAMALHGALAGHGRSAAGMLVSLRALDLKVPRLDLVEGDIRVSARREADTGAQSLYGFELHAGAEPLLSGRATVVLSLAS